MIEHAWTRLGHAPRVRTWGGRAAALIFGGMLALAFVQTLCAGSADPWVLAPRARPRGGHRGGHREKAVMPVFVG
jgi:hypothetical protein